VPEKKKATINVAKTNISVYRDDDNKCASFIYSDSRYGKRFPEFDKKIIFFRRGDDYATVG